MGSVQAPEWPTESSAPLSVYAMEYLGGSDPRNAAEIYHTTDLTQEIYCDAEDLLEGVRVAFGGWWLLVELLKTDWG